MAGRCLSHAVLPVLAEVDGRGGARRQTAIDGNLTSTSANIKELAYLALLARRQPQRRQCLHLPGLSCSRAGYSLCTRSCPADHQTGCLFDACLLEGRLGEELYWALAICPSELVLLRFILLLLTLLVGLVKPAKQWFSKHSQEKVANRS